MKELTQLERDIFDCTDAWGVEAAVLEFGIGEGKVKTIYKKGGGDGSPPLVDRRVMLNDDDSFCFSLSQIIFKAFAYLEAQNAKVAEQNAVLLDQLQRERQINKELRRILRQGEHRVTTQLMSWARHINEEAGNESEESDLTRFRKAAGMA